MSDNSAPIVWQNMAERLSALTARRWFVRVPAGEGWRVVVQPDEWTDDLLRDAVRIPVDGGPDLQGEIVLPRHASDQPDPLGSQACRDVVGALAETLGQLVIESRARELAVARERRLDTFARSLVGCAIGPGLHAVIVEHMARAVGAEIGAIAVPVAGDGSLGVTATYGYPAVVVQHERQAPGEGILGRVFATGQAVVVRDVGATPGHAPRRRYRSSSYLAFPLSGAEGVQAVVAVTDKSDGSAFDDRDLATVTALGAPAALALDREEFQARCRRLADQGTVDGLTGLVNRRYVEIRLDQEIRRQRRKFDALALLLIDLDNFKDLNDSQGHLVGDRVLREVADILRRAVRIFDVCGRHHGGTFVILMPGADVDTALRIAERIRRQVERHFASGARAAAPAVPTVSVGVSSAHQTTNRETLVAQAESALLQAKGTGKNVVCVYP